MNDKHVKGIAVISIADGEKLGTIDRIDIDPEAKRIVRFVVTSGGGFMSGEEASSNFVDPGDVHALGPDALTLNDKSALKATSLGVRRGESQAIEELTKRKVVTEGGTVVGQVASVEFDPRSFRLTQIEVSPGFFAENRMVPIHQVVSTGADLVVVRNAVCTPDGEAATEGTSRVEYYPA